MPQYSGSARETIAGPPQAVWDLMLDYERLPEWQGPVKGARVLSRDDHGRGREVAYEIDVRVAVVRYTLRHRYEDLRLIDSEYVEGDFRDCHGRWTFEAGGDRTTVACFEMAIDPGRMIPGPVRRMMSQRVMRASLEDLRGHFETATR